MNAAGYHDPASSPIMKQVDGPLKLPEISGTYLAAYIFLSALLALQLFYVPASNLLVRWRFSIEMVSSKVASLLEHSYGTLNRILSTGLESDASRSGLATALGLQRLPGLRAPGFLAGSHLGGAGRGVSPSTALGDDDRPPPGLGNWDNSCYQNSVLQGLSSLRFVPAYLDRIVSDHSDSVHSSASVTPTVLGLRKLVSDLNSLENSGRVLWTPPALKSMNSWQQQDAQEYFSKILDQLDKELARAAESAEKQNDPGLRAIVDNTRILEAAKEIQDVADIEIDAKQLTQVTTDVISRLRTSSVTQLGPLHNPLEGFLAQRVGCLQCGWSEGLSMIPFICLTVPLGKGWDFELDSCLDEYTKLEHIEGVECAKCTLLKSRTQLEALLAKFQDPDTASDKTSLSPSTEEFLHTTVMPRLKAVNSALDDEDFSESSLVNKCKIAARNRVTSTKSRQAVIARAPKSLVIHINRSVFDERSGAQRKNYAHVRFPKTLDLHAWCLAFNPDGDKTSMGDRVLDPHQSLLAGARSQCAQEGPFYQVRAAVTHYGRHEDGHYICYRQYPSFTPGKAPLGAAGSDAEAEEAAGQHWWRLSDEEVTMVTEEDVLEQGGVFMLFYEQVDPAMVAKGGTKDAEDVVVAEQNPPAIVEADHHHHSPDDLVPSPPSEASSPETIQQSEAKPYPSPSTIIDQSETNETSTTTISPSLAAEPIPTYTTENPRLAQDHPDDKDDAPQARTTPPSPSSTKSPPSLAPRRLHGYSSPSSSSASSASSTTTIDAQKNSDPRHKHIPSPSSPSSSSPSSAAATATAAAISSLIMAN